MLAVVALSAAWLFFMKRRNRRFGPLKSRRRGGGLLVSTGVIVAIASIWGLSVSATPTMSIQSSLSSADITLEQNQTSSQTVQNTIKLAANSSTGYALETQIAQSSLPNSGATISVLGGDVTNATVVSTNSTRLVTRDTNTAQSSVPISIKATADSSVPAGNYEVRLRFIVKSLPTIDQAQSMANAATLMSANLNAGDYVSLKDFTYTNDEVKVVYKIVDSLPSDQVLRRIAMPLANGKYAIPQALNTKLIESNNTQRVNEFLSVAQTYADAGSQLKWDPSRDTPLHTTTPIHSSQTAPYALTCSSFVNMALSAWRYSDTTYVANTNTASYPWGTKFARPSGMREPFQAWKLLQWMYWQNRVALYTGVDDYQPGDILFFSKQDPEGPGTSGVYFMNVYHTAIYLGNGKVIHSYSDQTPNGVMVEELKPSLKSDLTFVARPNLGH